MLLSKLFTLSVIIVGATAEFHLRNQVIVNHGYSDISDEIFDNLSREDGDFINFNINKVQIANGSACDKCKSRIINAKNLVEQNPDKEHLVGLLLFKNCLNTQWREACQWTDFFVTTSSRNEQRFNDDGPDAGISSISNVNFYDNDFLQIIKRFNTSSEYDLETYCYFKGNKACKLPATPNVTELFDLESWWPKKDSKYNKPPVYTNNSETFNVLHASDFHIQLDYKLGAEGNCTLVPCGTSSSYSKDAPGKTYNFTDYYKSFNSDVSGNDISFYPDSHYDENAKFSKGDYYDFPQYFGWSFNKAPATSFGAYLSDAPYLLVNNSIVEMKKLHQEKNFESIIFTGDSFSHNGELANPDELKFSEAAIFNLINHYLNGVQVFSALGNHDTMFRYAEVAPRIYVSNASYYWNEDYVTDLWVNNGWFDKKDADAIKTHYTGYSFTTKRGLKVIGLNSNFYCGDNLWSYGETTTKPDKFGIWKFLIDELVDSESHGQRVWILAHIPSNNYDVLPIQSHIFAAIVKRFSPYTIANLFFGHTHRTQYSVYYSTNDTSKIEDALTVSWVNPSVTPYTNFNPGFRYYEVENESFNIRNSFSYYFDLNGTFTNSGNEPTWKLEYSARESYDPKGTWPKDAPLNGTFWHSYVSKYLWNTTDTHFNQKFMNNKYRQSPLTPNCTTAKNALDNKCFNDNNCFLYFLSDDNINCQKG